MSEFEGRVKGKVALVTGGASGLGRAIAALLVKHGATTIITDLQEQKGRETARDIGASFILQDVSSEEQWRSILEQVKGEHGV